MRYLVVLLFCLGVVGCGTSKIEKPKVDLSEDVGNDLPTVPDLVFPDVEEVEEVEDPCANVQCPAGKVCQYGDCVDGSLDNDGDGYNLLEDCNDLDKDINPGVSEICDGVDNNCNGVRDEGFDQDGDGYPSCHTSLGRDCDDTNENVNPGQKEVCDGVDNDCDGETDRGIDEDLDGYEACGVAEELIDCNDQEDEINPGVAESCDEFDNNCDGQTNEGGICIGCSDGARDQLTDESRWPTVAACKGEFPRGSLRATRTNSACGDDLGTTCPVPEDLCAQGWHICMRDGYQTDLRFKLTSAECNSLPNIYVAATNNCSNSASVSPRDTGCNMAEPLGCYPTGWCSAPVACGPTETSHCAHAVWPQATRIFGIHAGRTENNGCGSISSDTSYSGQGKLTGVLCCAD